jgi:hypothetical protein
MLTVVCWKWGYKYTDAHVRNLRAGVARHLTVPHRFVCLSDGPIGGVETMPLPYRTSHANSRRLWICSREAESLGERLFQIDLDMVVTGDLTPLVERGDPFVIWKSDSVGLNGYALNPSLILMTPGAVSHVWDWFQSHTDAVHVARKHGRKGSDQAVLTHCLKPTDVATWTEADGIIAYRVVCGPDGERGKTLPPGVRMVSFHGPRDPSHPKYQAASPWIAEHWRC